MFVSVPLIEAQYPSAAYGSLQPIIQKNNLSAEFVDINIKLKQEMSEEMFDDLNNWSMFASSTIQEDTLSHYLDAVDRYLISKLDKTVEWIGISVLSYFSARPTTALLKHLQSKNIHTKILLGGNGLSSKLPESNNQEYGEWCLDQGLCDFAIFGEGELALDNLLKENTQYPGINNPMFEQVRDLDRIEDPDYSGIKWDEYQDPRIMITSSRGCVRHCTFCDIATVWPKFSYRSAERVVNEIKESVHRYGLTKFEFTDSLINGSVTNFDRFNDLLANEKERDPALKDVTYTGQFICRNQSKMPERTYELMHYAGCKQITVGIESFSERVRHHIKKKFSDADIEYHLEMCARWNIPNVFLMIVGYPTETLADHQANIRALHRYKKYSDSGTIFMMRWGFTMHIYDGTPISSMSDDLQITTLGVDNSDSVYNWVSALNPSNTLPERIRRRLELHELRVELGYAMPGANKELLAMLEIAKNYSGKNNTFFPKVESNG